MASKGKIIVITILLLILLQYLTPLGRFSFNANSSFFPFSSSSSSSSSPPSPPPPPPLSSTFNDPIEAKMQYLQECLKLCANRTRAPPLSFNASAVFPLSQQQQEQKQNRKQKEEESYHKRFAIFVLSGAGLIEKRKRQREHCFPHYKQTHTRYMVSIGAPGFDDRPRSPHINGQLPPLLEQCWAREIMEEHNLFQDIYMSPHRDYYLDLSEKVMNSFKHILHTYPDVDYILKVDDDRCANTTIIHQIINEHEKNYPPSSSSSSELYAGAHIWDGAEFSNMLGPNGEKSKFVGGPVYVVSKNLLRLILEDDWNHSVLKAMYGTSSEDANMGKWIDYAIAKHNISVSYKVFPQIVWKSW